MTATTMRTRCDGTSSLDVLDPVITPKTSSSTMWIANAETCATPTEATATGGSTPDRWTYLALTATPPTAAGAISEANEVMMLKDFEFRQVERTVTEAIELAADWGGAYREASDQTRRRMNQAFFKRFLVDFGGVTRAEVTDDFAAMLMHDLVARFEQQAPEPTRRYDAEASDLVLLG